MDSFKPHLGKIATGAALTREEARDAFEALLSGEVTHAQAGAFLMGLRVRGEALSEIVGAVEAMRSRMTRVAAPPNAIDIVGTGGDGAGSYNISTLAAIIVAGCGVPVAKHGNRAASSKSGAADVLTALGVRIGLLPEGLEACLAEAGLAGGVLGPPGGHSGGRGEGVVGRFDRSLGPDAVQDVEHSLFSNRATDGCAIDDTTR